MNITEEKINRNYLLWIDYLKKYNCYSDSLIEEYGEKIKMASFAMNETSGGAYQGSLLDIVLCNLCVIASHINENSFGLNDKGRNRHPFLYVNKNSLMKVLLLHLPISFQKAMRSEKQALSLLSLTISFSFVQEQIILIM